jgi:adenylosuccinate lyase
MRCWKTGRPLRELLLADKKVSRRATPADLDKVFDVSRHFRHVDRTFKKLGL